MVQRFIAGMILCAGAVVCHADVAVAADDPAAETTIVTLGDSITRGVRSGVNADETFAARLEQLLRADGVSVRVANVGIGGERTDQGLARLDQAVLSLKPHLVTIMYGTNDCHVDVGKTESRLTAEQYAANLRELVAKLRAAQIVPVLMTPPPYGKSAGPNGVGEHPNIRVEKYAAACRKVAAETKCALVDHYADWKKRENDGADIGSWTTDQCHPNPEGHAIMAEAMLPVVKEALNITVKN